MVEGIHISSGRFGRVALIDLNHSLVRHAHPHCHVLIKTAGADSRFVVGDETVALTDDLAVLVNPWTPHTYLHQKQQPTTTVLALYILPDWLAEFRDNWASSGAADFFVSPCGMVGAEIRRRSIELADAITQAPGHAADHQDLLAALMVEIIERFTEWRAVGTPRSGISPNKIMDWRVRRTIDSIRTAPGAILSVDDLADIGGMSRANFFRRFEASTGLTPRIFQNVFRIEEALRAAAYTDESFGALSDRLGFANQAYFTRFFRNHAAIAPSQLRAAIRLSTRTDDPIRDSV